MKTSGYYLEKREQEKAKSKKYKKRINELKAIRTTLTTKFDDNVYTINNAISNLQKEMDEAIDGCRSYHSTISDATNHQELFSERDSNLSEALITLNNEISRLEQAKSNADYYKELYNNQYKDALMKEMKEVLL